MRICFYFICMACVCECECAFMRCYIFGLGAQFGSVWLVFGWHVMFFYVPFFSALAVRTHRVFVVIVADFFLLVLLFVVSVFSNKFMISAFFVVLFILFAVRFSFCKRPYVYIALYEYMYFPPKQMIVNCCVVFVWKMQMAFIRTVYSINIEFAWATDLLKRAPLRSFAYLFCCH